VHAAVDLGPGNLTRVFALEEEGCIFGAGEAEDLYIDGRSVSKLELGVGLEWRTHFAVAADKELALTGINTVARERVDFDFL
jgi:hypothetical protein